jgi:WD40 repeat protein
VSIRELTPSLYPSLLNKRKTKTYCGHFCERSYKRLKKLAALLLVLAVPFGANARTPLIARLGEKQKPSGISIIRLAFAPDGRTLAALDAGGSLRLWDLGRRKPLAVWGDAPTPIRCFAYSADARLLAAADEKTIHLWTPTTGAVVRSFPHSLGRIAALSFAPDGKILAAARRGPSEREAAPVRLFDIRGGRQVRKIPLETEVDPAMSFLADGKTLALRGRLWAFHDVGTGTDATRSFLEQQNGTRIRREEKSLFRPSDEYAPHSLFVFSPNGRLAAVAEERTVRIYDVPTGRQRCAFSPGRLRRLHFAPDSRILVLRKEAVNEMLYLWEVHSGQEVAPFVCLDRTIDAEAMGPDGATLAAALSDGTIELHDIRPDAWRLIRQRGLASWQIQRCWSYLMSADGWAGDEAAWMLAADPQKALPLLKEQLHRFSSDEEIQRLIQDLDSDSYPTREAATRELQRLGLAAEPALSRILHERPSLEMRHRAQGLLDAIDQRWTLGPAGESLRAVRAVRALERMGTKEAFAILKDLGRGGIGAWQTQEAREATQRLRLRLGNVSGDSR